MNEKQISAIIDDYLQGNEDAFYLIVDEYKDRVYEICYRVVGDYDDANDVSQDVFLRVYSSLKKFKHNSSFSTWLYRIAVNSSISFLKKSNSQKKRVDTSSDLTNIESGDRSSDIDNLIQESIKKLDEKDRVVVVLKDIEGFSYEEISSILHINIGTVKSRLSRSREKLKVILRRFL